MDDPRFPEIAPVAEMPENTAVFASAIMINIEGMSPAWVQELAATKAGRRLLRRALAGIIRKHEKEAR